MLISASIACSNQPAPVITPAPVTNNNSGLSSNGTSAGNKPQGCQYTSCNSELFDIQILSNGSSKDAEFMKLVQGATKMLAAPDGENTNWSLLITPKAGNLDQFKYRINKSTVPGYKSDNISNQTVTMAVNSNKHGNGSLIIEAINISACERASGGTSEGTSAEDCSNTENSQFISNIAVAYSILNIEKVKDESPNLWACMGTAIAGGFLDNLVGSLFEDDSSSIIGGGIQAGTDTATSILNTQNNCNK